MDERTRPVRTAPLRHVADVRTSSVDKHTRDGELSVQLCNYTDVYRSDQVRPTPDLMRATATSDEIARFRLEVGDSVLTKDSEDPNDIGISAHVADTASDFVCGYHLAIARPSPGTHPRYLTWALRSRPVLDHFSNHASGISRYGLTTAGLRAAPVPWHDELEQRRIADFLDDRVARIDQIIAARETQLQALEPLRRAAVVTALNDELRVPLRRLLSRIVTGGTPSAEMDDPSGLSWYSPGGFSPALTLGDPTRRVSPEDAVLFRAQSVLIVGIGATAGKVAWLDHRGSGNQQLTCLEHDPQRAEGRFLLHQLDAMRDGILRQAPLATLPILNNEFVKSIDVAVPELSQQRRLARQWDARLSEDTATAGSLTRSIALLGECKQSLITAAVTGEIDVTTAGSGIPG